MAQLATSGKVLSKLFSDSQKLHKSAVYVKKDRLDYKWVVSWLVSENYEEEKSEIDGVSKFVK